MSRQYDNYIHSLLEPNDDLINGNQKRFLQQKPLPAWAEKNKLLEGVPPEIELTHEEMNKRQDAYLKSKGIN